MPDLSTQLQILAARRRLLVARAAIERQQAALAVAAFETPLSNLERALAMIGWVRTHLWWAIAGGAALTASGRARRWLLTSWQVWRLVAPLLTRRPAARQERD